MPSMWLVEVAEPSCAPLCGWPQGPNLVVFLLVHLFIFERASARTSRVGAESEGDTESEAGSRLRAVSTEPDAGLEPTNLEIMT